MHGILHALATLIVLPYVALAAAFLLSCALVLLASGAMLARSQVR